MRRARFIFAIAAITPIFSIAIIFADADRRHFAIMIIAASPLSIFFDFLYFA
jgi:hypothetical protein